MGFKCGIVGLLHVGNPPSSLADKDGGGAGRDGLRLPMSDVELRLQDV